MQKKKSGLDSILSIGSDILGFVPGFQWAPLLGNTAVGAEHGGLKGAGVGLLEGIVGGGIPGGIPGISTPGSFLSGGIPGLTGFAKDTLGDIGGGLGGKLAGSAGALAGNTAGEVAGSVLGSAATGLADEAINQAAFGQRPQGDKTGAAKPKAAAGPTGGGGGAPVLGSTAPKVYPWAYGGGG